MFRVNLTLTLTFWLSIFSMPAAIANSLEKLPKSCHFSSQFEQKKTLATLPVPLISSGKLYFSCQSGLIWQTEQPIREVLILTNKNSHFQEQSQDSEKSLQSIDSIQIQFLSNLLIGLMSADQNYIQKNFNVIEIDSHSFQLVPLKSFLRKAIDTITIKNNGEKKELFIDIVQTNDTKMSIRSHSPRIFENTLTHESQCSKIGISQHLCSALFNPIKTANKLDDSVEN